MVEAYNAGFSAGPRVVLCDVDGVAADYCAGVDALTRDVGYEPGDWTDYATEANAPYRVVDYLRIAPGAAFDLPAFDGAVDAVRAFELDPKAPTLVWVTVRFKGAPHWQWDRERWLRTFSTSEILTCTSGAAKAHVRGDVLIEDNVDNLRGWLDANPASWGILIDAPYNLDPRILLPARSHRAPSLAVALDQCRFGFSGANVGARPAPVCYSRVDPCPM